jgi:DNA-directed RNA polymerase specialized sigma24 family protein
MSKVTGINVSDNKDAIEKIKKDIKDSELKFGINRKEENSDVLEYAQTGDESIFERIYSRRLPTIEHLARQYNWLSDSAASEIKIVFIKTIREYGKNGRKTDFNTFFYSSVKNNFVNAIKRKYRKKRTTIDGCDPLNKTLPLDEFINDDENSVTMHEFISDDHLKNGDLLHFEDCVNLLSGHNELLSLIIKSFSGLTRNQILREKTLINYSFPVVSGDILEDVYLGAGMSRNCFDIEKTEVKDGKIYSELKVNPKNVIVLLQEKLNSDKEICNQIRG